eukprot:scaffold204633_cov26-Tisochrysis_lutea.AAC.1
MSSRAACSSGSLIAMRSACKEDTMALEAVAAYAPGRRDAALAVEANAIAATAASRKFRRSSLHPSTRIQAAWLGSAPETGVAPTGQGGVPMCYPASATRHQGSKMGFKATQPKLAWSRGGRAR